VQRFGQPLCAWGSPKVGVPSLPLFNGLDLRYSRCLMETELMYQRLLSPVFFVFLLACTSADKPFLPASSLEPDTGSAASGSDEVDVDVDVDVDGDGWPASEDCDDTNAAVNPGAAEECNGVDDDCVGGIDDGVGQWWYRDADGDSYGGEVLGQFCDAPEGATYTDGDCADNNPDIHPGSTLQVDGQDSDCDGLKDWLVSVMVAVDDAGELCINDEVIGPTGGWREGLGYQVWLRSGPNTVGIHGWDTGRVITAAIAHLEISDGTVWVTDDTWRYDPEPDQDGEGKSGWCRPGFDDSEWDTALDLGPIGDPENPWSDSPTSFPADSPAHWIWDHFPVNLNTQYLRLDFDLP